MEEALNRLVKEINKIWVVTYGNMPEYRYLPKREVKKFDYYIGDISFQGNGREGFIYAHLYDKNGGLEISADLPYILNKFGGATTRVRNYKYYVVACITFQQSFIDLLKGKRAMSHN